MLEVQFEAFADVFNALGPDLFSLWLFGREGFGFTCLDAFLLFFLALLLDQSFLFDECIVLLDLFLQFEDLHIDWRQLFPQLLVLEDLLVDLSAYLIFFLEVVLVR